MPIDNRTDDHTALGPRVAVGLLVLLEAKPGKEAEVEAFLQSALAAVAREAATTAWFALKFGERRFGIFDVFPDDTGRRAHLTGPVAAALLARAAELFAGPPVIEPVDALASKLPSAGAGALASTQQRGGAGT